MGAATQAASGSSHGRASSARRLLAGAPAALLMLAGVLACALQAHASVTLATLYSLSETNTTFAAGRTSTPLSGQTAARHRRGTVFSFSLDKPATVTVSIQRRGAGRRVRGRCRAVNRRLRSKPTCARYAIVKTLTRSAHVGSNTIAFSARFNGKALAPGGYRAIFTATNSAGAERPQALAFTIVAR